jgi:hypothetical protein
MRSSRVELAAVLLLDLGDAGTRQGLAVTGRATLEATAGVMGATEWGATTSALVGLVAVSGPEL